MDAVSLMSTLSTLLLIGCALVGAKPAHEVQKRATVAEVLGDLTAGAAGILNEDSKYSEKHAQDTRAFWRQLG